MKSKAAKQIGMIDPAVGMADCLVKPNDTLHIGSIDRLRRRGGGQCYSKSCCDRLYRFLGIRDRQHFPILVGLVRSTPMILGPELMLWLFLDEDCFTGLILVATKVYGMQTYD